MQRQETDKYWFDPLFDRLEVALIKGRFSASTESSLILNN